MVRQATRILIALAIVTVASACTTGADEAPSASEVTPATSTPTSTPTPTATADPVAAVLDQCADAVEPADAPVVLMLGASSEGFDADRLEGPRHCEPFTIILSNTQGSAEHMVAVEPMVQIGVQVFKGELIGKSETITYQIPPLPSGEYQFVCNPHRQFMQGTLVVSPPS